MTGNDVIEEVQRLLLSSSREEMNKLQTAVSANANTLVTTFDPGGIRSGSEINIDLETYRVWSVSGNTITVQPAMNGSTSASHAAGSLIYVNPRFSRASIFSALNDELRALAGNPAGLYQMKTLEFNLNGVVTDYDLAPDVQEVYEVRMSVPGPSLHWDQLLWSRVPNVDTTNFPSGNAVHIITGYPGRPVQVLYKAPFELLTTPSQDLNTQAGVPETMQDIVVLGIMLRLGPMREIKRNFTETQGESRRAEEVAAGAVASSFNSVRVLYRDRIVAEANRLNQKYPMHHR